MAAVAESHRRLIRNRRNISWYKQNSDFWGWYKYFTENGNAEAVSIHTHTQRPTKPPQKRLSLSLNGWMEVFSLFLICHLNKLTGNLLLPSQVQEMDRIYLAYLQNKNRAEGRRSYKAYLRHLGEIYKTCADSDDPNCVATHTTRPKPEPPKPAPVKTCDPTKDAYCLYAALVQGKSPYQPLVLPAAAPAPAPVKAPAPLYVRSAAPAKDPQSGYHYYAPSATSFLSKV